MTQLLVQGEVILAQGPFTVTEYEIESADAIYPKHVIDGWEIVEAPVPKDFQPSRFFWNDGLYEKAPVPAPVVVPQSVSRAQGLIALEMAGYLSLIEAYLADPSTPKVKVLAFNNAQTFERNSPMLAEFAAMLSLTEADVDNLFITAGQVVL
jgi:hypothetical protein